MLLFFVFVFVLKLSFFLHHSAKLGCFQCELPLLRASCLFELVVLDHRSWTICSEPLAHICVQFQIRIRTALCCFFNSWNWARSVKYTRLLGTESENHFILGTISKRVFGLIFILIHFAYSTCTGTWWYYKFIILIYSRYIILVCCYETSSKLVRTVRYDSNLYDVKRPSNPLLF